MTKDVYIHPKFLRWYAHMCLREMHYLPLRTYIYVMRLVRSATVDVCIRPNLSYFVTGLVVEWWYFVVVFGCSITELWSGAGISFFLCMAGAQNKANLDEYIRPWSLICTTWSQYWRRENVFVGRIYTSSVDEGFKASTYTYTSLVFKGLNLIDIFWQKRKTKNKCIRLHKQHR